jgi:hypothetical protein
VGFLTAQRTVAYWLAAAVACSVPAVSAHAERAQTQADVVFMRDTQGDISSAVIASVDAAVVRALGEVAGIRKPSFSPVDYREVQLTVGCNDDSSYCLTAVTHVAEADAIVVRHLLVDPHGAVVLRLLYFDEAGGPTQVQAAVLAEHALELAQAVPDLVRELFEIPEAATHSVTPAALPPSPPPDAAGSDARVSAGINDRGASISALTWIALGVGASALAVGVVLAVTANADYDDLRSTRVRTLAQAQDAHRTFSSIETRATLANVLIPAGAVVLGAGAVLLGIDLLSDESSAEAPGTSVQLIPLPSGGVLAVHGRFGGAL